MVEGFLKLFPEGQDLTTDLVEAHIGKSWNDAK